MTRAQLAQLGRFLVAGLSAVGTDWLLYFLATRAGMVAWLAKATSFVAGALVSFVVNRAFTFRAKAAGTLRRHALLFAFLYAVTLGLNVLTNAAALALGSGKGLAFLLATGCSTVANFLGMKFLVFSTRTTHGAAT